MPTLEARLTINPRRALDMLRQERRLRKAAKAIPRPMPWDWAKARLMPLLAGPYLGPDPLVTLVGSPGCAVNVGVEVQGTYLLVDRSVAERWECSDQMLEQTALANLDRRAAKLDARSLTHGTLSGRIVRLLESVPWASSLVLVPEHLLRVFGSHDQVLGTPRRDLLGSVPIDTPGHIAAEIFVDLESRSAYPLWLDPFLILEGELHWEPQLEQAGGDN